MIISKDLFLLGEQDYLRLPKDEKRRSKSSSNTAAIVGAAATVSGAETTTASAISSDGGAVVSSTAAVIASTGMGKDPNDDLRWVIAKTNQQRMKYCCGWREIIFSRLWKTAECSHVLSLWVILVCCVVSLYFLSSIKNCRGNQSPVEFLREIPQGIERERQREGEDERLYTANQECPLSRIVSSSPWRSIFAIVCLFLSATIFIAASIIGNDLRFFLIVIVKREKLWLVEQLLDSTCIIQIIKWLYGMIRIYYSYTCLNWNYIVLLRSPMTSRKFNLHHNIHW